MQAIVIDEVDPRIYRGIGVPVAASMPGQSRAIRYFHGATLSIARKGLQRSGTPVASRSAQRQSAGKGPMPSRAAPRKFVLEFFLRPSDGAGHGVTRHPFRRHLPKLIRHGLQAAIAASTKDYPFTAEMVVFLWKRVNTVKNRFLALAALIQTGGIPRERSAKPRARRRPETAKPQGINWRKWLPMGTFAWLCGLMQSRHDRFGAAQFAEPLRQLLGRAEMRALLAPLCFMLGIEASLPRPVCPVPPAPEPAPAAECVASEPDPSP